MRLTTIGRMLGALCLAGSLTYAASGTASAGAPTGWAMTAVPIPDTVGAGNAALYEVTIYNYGPSNISSLYLRSTASPVVFLQNDPARPTACPATSGALYCSFGALAGGTASNPNTITIRVGFTPGSNGFDPGFYANTTGASINDKKNSSHGDVLRPSVAPTTSVVTSNDFNGGFVLDTSGVSTAAVGSKNNQSTSVIPPTSDVVAIVSDGAGNTQTLPNGHTVTFNCPTTKCIGDWSRIFVRSIGGYQANSETFTEFKVSVTIRGSLVSNPADLKLVHVTDDGTTTVLYQSTPCGTHPTDPLIVDHCLNVTKTGQNYTLTTWVTQNGGMKGMT